LKHLRTPLTDEAVAELRAGDRVAISGILYAARDATHRAMVEALEGGEELPVDLRGQVIYYMGPTPARPGRVLGAAGPTTASRMDPYTPRLLDEGLKGMIGKGRRGPEVVEAIAEHGAVYFAAIGGAGALLSGRIKKAEVAAYPDLGPEALLRLEVEEFPAVVAVDSKGGDVYSRIHR